MKCVVTGGAGFIGSHLTERLLREGHEVLVLDNLSVGREENLRSVSGSRGFRFVRADVRDRAAIAPCFKGVERVFHLAALADIVPSITDPSAYFTTNVTGTMHVLEESRSNGVKRFVYAASSSCYGIPDRYPTSEEAPIDCRYPYALTKYLGEQTVLHWAQVYGLSALSLRFFNVYGPRVRTNGTYGAVFGVFLAQLANGQPLTVVGDGSQTRDFTYVSDAVDALLTAADSRVSGECFNVGSGGTYSVKHLTELLGGRTVTLPKRPGEPDRTYADISKIRTRLGWSPKVSFAEGVGEMKRHLDDWRQAPVWTESSIADATKDWFRYLNK